MATSAVSTSSSFTSEKINYIRLSTLLTDIGTKVLRKVLDSLIPPGNLQKHLNSSKAGLNKLRKKRVLHTQQWNKLYPTSGVPSSNDFDITLLFLLLRNTVSSLTAPFTGWDAAPLPTDESTEADLIRVKRCRNEIVAHRTEAELSDADFDNHWDEIEKALVRLGGPPFEPDIKRLKIESTDPEHEADMNVLLQSWEEDEKMNSQDLNDIKKILTNNQKKPRPKPFCILPQKPSHDTVDRHDEVSMTLEKISHLRTTFPSHITVTYLSGNPGCGKSELARQIGEKFFDDIDKEQTSTFVATLDASTQETLIQSYMKLAYQIGCNELSVQTTIANDKISLEQKLSSLQALVLAKVENYSLWLMVVDNVEDIQMVSQFVPHSGQKIPQGNGHILVTTQDATSIPTSDSHTHHIRLNRGMKSNDAAQSLYTISGFPCSEKIALQVCKKLDYQPLALACAAHYLQQTRSLTDSTMNWEAYLVEFEKAGICDQEPMRTAVKMAVEKALEKSQVLQHAFAFLAAIAPEFISIKHVINYVLQCMPDHRKLSVAKEIASSSLIIISEDPSINRSVRVHQVVHDAFQSVCQAMFQQEDTEFSFLMTFTQVFSYLSDMCVDDVGFVKTTASLVQHFVCFTEKVKQYFEQHQILKILKEGNQYGMHYEGNKLFMHNYIRLTMFLGNVVSKICMQHYRYHTAKTVLEIAYCIMKENNGKNPQSCLTAAEKSITTDESYYIRTDSDVLATILNKLGIVLGHLEKLDEAKECFQKALAIQESTYGSNHPGLATTLSNYGLLLQKLEKRDRGKRALRQSRGNSRKRHETLTGYLTRSNSEDMVASWFKRKTWVKLTRLDYFFVHFYSHIITSSRPEIYQQFSDNAGT